jgi:hypothetical protein
MTRFIYALKEIRACLRAEILTDTGPLAPERHHRGDFPPVSGAKFDTDRAPAQKADMT